MLDEFLKFGAGFDWITPLWAFIQDAKYGQPFQINVPYRTGYSGGQITAALNEKGVRTWGLMVVGESITFTVRRPQARYALYWLARWGVPYQARVDKLPVCCNAAHKEGFDEDYGESIEGYHKTIYAVSDEPNGEMKDSQPYSEGLIGYSLRRINVLADRLSGREFNS